MFRIDPRFIGVEEARRREALAREIDQAWRDWADFRRKIAALQLETKWPPIRVELPYAIECLPCLRACNRKASLLGGSGGRGPRGRIAAGRDTSFGCFPKL